MILERHAAVGGIVYIGLEQHGDLGADVAVLPVGLADYRLDLADVQQLGDEREQAVALPLYGRRLVADRLWHLCVFPDFAAQSEYHRQRRPELMGNVGKEVFAQPAGLSHHLHAAVAHALHVEQCADDRQEQYHREPEEPCALLAYALLGLQFVLRHVDHLLLSRALDVDADIVYAVQLLVVQDAVLIGGGDEMVVERLVVAALALHELEVEMVYLDDMLPRVDLASRGVGPVEQRLCLGVLVGVIIDRSQCQTRFESVPEVFQVGHHAV